MPSPRVIIAAIACRFVCRVSAPTIYTGCTLAWCGVATDTGFGVFCAFARTRTRVCVCTCVSLCMCVSLHGVCMCAHASLIHCTYSCPDLWFHLSVFVYRRDQVSAVVALSVANSVACRIPSAGRYAEWIFAAPVVHSANPVCRAVGLEFHTCPIVCSAVDPAFVCV